VDTVPDSVPSAPAPAFAALRHRNFRLFITGQFLSLCGTWMQTIAQGWLVLQLTNSPFWVGVVGTMGSLPILVFTLYGGVLADRVNRRHGIILLQSLMLLEALTLGTLTAMHRITLPWIIVLATLLGSFTAFEVPLRQAFVIEMVGREDLMNAIAFNSLAFNGSRIVGPAIAGVLIATVGLASCFYANGFSYLAVLAGLLLIRVPPAKAPIRSAAALRDLREGVRYAMGHQRPRSLLLLTATLSIFGFSFLTMLPVFARDVVHSQAAGYGGLMSGLGVGAAAGGLAIAASRRVDPGLRLVRWAGIIFGCSLMALALVDHYASAFILLAVAGCAMILNNVMTNTDLQTSAPDELRGRVMGFYSLMVLGMAPFGSFQAGWVSERIGVQGSLAIGGVACLVAAWWFTRTLGVARRER